MTDELRKLLDAAVARVNEMSPAERDAMFEEQKRAMAKLYREGTRETQCVVVGPTSSKTSFAAPAAPQPDFRAILLNLVVSLTLTEGRGDVMEDAWRALALAEVQPPASVETDGDLADWLGETFDANGLWAMAG